MTILEAIQSGITNAHDIRVASGLSRKVFRTQLNLLIAQEKIMRECHRTYRLVGAPELPPLILEWMGYPLRNDMAKTCARQNEQNAFEVAF